MTEPTENPQPIRTDPGIWTDFDRPLPAWFDRAKFGIFIHWGPYSVPAWAEPSGALGAVPESEWFAHNAYAEWYFNTIRIPGSPAAEHHRQTYGDAPYDDFLDAWTASGFDPQQWAQLFAEAGADYVVPTTKHHDGVTLWEAPGTGARNTVHRGPRRDLVGAIADAVRAQGLRFGVYYSGGLDWSVTRFGPHTTMDEVRSLRPVDAAYNTYAYLHVQDLVDRYHPDILWNDIEWPDAGKRTGPQSLHQLFTDFYRGNPEGVVNDRWGDTHADYATSEYEAHLEAEQAAQWENNRGIGFSFGYNQVEDEKQYLTGPALARHLVDVASRGGRFLLNVGPTADGQIHPVQQQSLRDLGDWQRRTGDVVRGSSPVPAEVAAPGQQPWLRWLRTAEHLVAFVDPDAGQVKLTWDAEVADADGAQVRGAGARLEGGHGSLVVHLQEPEQGPVAVLLPLRAGR